MLSGVLFFLLVFVLNVVPAFAPPTWLTLAIIGMAVPSAPPVLLALIAAVAAAAGRLTLAKFARGIVRNHFLADRTRQNIDELRLKLQEHPALTFSGVLAWAFSPVPSNLLFIAYGLTTLRLRLIVPPFFIGRVVSYSFWAMAGNSVGSYVARDGTTVWMLGVYMLLSGIAGLAILLAFLRLDWRALLWEKQLKWLRK